MHGQAAEGQARLGCWVSRACQAEQPLLPIISSEIRINCTVFVIKRDICRKAPIFHTPRVFNLHDPPESLRFPPKFQYKLSESLSY